MYQRDFFKKISKLLFYSLIVKTQTAPNSLFTVIWKFYYILPNILLRPSHKIYNVKFWKQTSYNFLHIYLSKEILSSNLLKNMFFFLITSEGNLLLRDFVKIKYLSWNFKKTSILLNIRKDVIHSYYIILTFIPPFILLLIPCKKLILRYCK